MAFVNIQLPPGIQRNATPYDTPNRWYDMNLIRFVSGTLKPIGGWQRLTSNALDSSARFIHVYRDNGNARHVIIGTEAKIYVDVAGIYTDITPSGLIPFSAIGLYAGFGAGDYGKDEYGTARVGIISNDTPIPFWSFSNWGEDVIFTNNADGHLYYYSSSNPTTAPAIISGAPGGNNSVIVTDERHVMAIGATSVGSGSPRRVAWSSRESISDWNVSSTTNTAGYLDLDARTPLLRGVKVREGVLIFSSSEAFLSRYIGQPYIYGIDRLADTSLQSSMSVAIYNGKAAWMGKNNFYRYEGGYLVPIQCPITNDVFGNIDPTYGPRRSWAMHNGTFPEVWFFYPSLGKTECDRYVTWNYVEDFWTWGALPRTAGAAGEAYPYPILGGVDKKIYQHETGWTDAGQPRASSGSIYAETGMLPLTDGGKGVIVNRVLPATGDGYQSMAVNFYARQTPEGTETTFGPYTARSDGYMDCRVTGRDVRMRIMATQDSDWSIGKFRMDVEQGHGR